MVVRKPDSERTLNKNDSNSSFSLSRSSSYKESSSSAEDPQRASVKQGAWSSLRNILTMASSRRLSGVSNKVSFSKDPPTVYPTLRRSDFTSSEACAYWTQLEELEAILKGCWSIVNAQVQSEQEKNEHPPRKMCTRGLENYIIERKTGKDVHRWHRKNAYSAVLRWGKGLGAEELARRYKIATKSCLQEALDHGKRDALIAKRIHSEVVPIPSGRRAGRRDSLKHSHSSRSSGTSSSRKLGENVDSPKTRKSTKDDRSSKKKDNKEVVAPGTRPIKKSTNEPDIRRPERSQGRPRPPPSPRFVPKSVQATSTSRGSGSESNVRRSHSDEKGTNPKKHRSKATLTPPLTPKVKRDKASVPSEKAVASSTKARFSRPRPE